MSTRHRENAEPDEGCDVHPITDWGFPDEDPLDAAKGIVLGFVLGLTCIVLAALLVWVLVA